MKTVRVRTGSRLHFGLLDPTGTSGRRHGGAGLMIEGPSLEVLASEGGGPGASGPLAERALVFAKRWREAESRAGSNRSRARGASLRVACAPGGHEGLGTGTQLALAVGAAFARLERLPVNPPELSRATGRGRRSAIGVWGFERGGFIVDGGKARGGENEQEEARGDALAPLVARLDVPAEWRIVLVRPAGARGLSGTPEDEAFRRLEGRRPSPPSEKDDTAARCRVLLLGVLPALAARDLPRFGRALTEFGRRAGEPFREAQGGIYASRRTEAVVSFLLSEGAAGAGQSSWGPATYAFAEDEKEARALAAAVLRRFDLRDEEVLVTRARNRGAEVEEA